nr:Dam family site-specific DNA-(adenine-N6)-methyltransferase [uncultured Draconibacterium sp.]
MIEAKVDAAKPFLRWAGGKTWLIKHFPLITNDRSFNNYHEPFLGGASIFFHLQPANRAFLSDINPKLIETYNCIKDDVEKVISILKQFRNTEEDYYRIRGAKYGSEFKRAARFIYLNQTSYNGIYRENLRGEYNVPYGHRTKNFLDSENLMQVSRSLQKAEILKADFRTVLERINENDLVFLDPPYTVSHNKNGFIKYNKNLFSLEDQYKLKEVIDEINERGAFYILTNAAHSKIDEIFSYNNKKLELPRASLIGGANAKRGQITEFIFTNI